MMMKIKHFLPIFFGLLLLLTECTVNREAIIPLNGSTPETSTPILPGLPPEQRERKASGEWTATRSGGGAPTQDPNFNTFKNFQYTFDVVGNNKKVNVKLSASVIDGQAIDVQFALYSPNGTRIETSSLSRNAEKNFTLNEGKYRIVVCAARRAVGGFKLTIVGINSELILDPSELLPSGNQNWGPLGGGGTVQTFKNHFYTFAVTEDNRAVDVELESEIDIYLMIYDELGQRILENFFTDRYQFGVLSLKKGVYRVMAATGTRGSVGNYRLNVVGKVKDLKRVESQVSSVMGNWANNSSSDTYELQLTADTSPLDMELSSATAQVRLEFQDNVGSTIYFEGFGDNKVFLLRQNVPKGKYRIFVRPNRDRGAGNYKLDVHGQFTDFKKL